MALTNIAPQIKLYLSKRKAFKIKAFSSKREEKKIEDPQ